MSCICPFLCLTCSENCPERGTQEITKAVNPENAKHNNCHLFCLLPVTLKFIVANSVDPNQTAPLGAV